MSPNFSAFCQTPFSFCNPPTLAFQQMQAQIEFLAISAQSLAERDPQEQSQVPFGRGNRAQSLNSEVSASEPRSFTRNEELAGCGRAPAAGLRRIWVEVEDPGPSVVGPWRFFRLDGVPGDQGARAVAGVRGTQAVPRRQQRGQRSWARPRLPRQRPRPPGMAGPPLRRPLRS